MMFNSAIDCLVGLVVTATVLLCLVRWLSREHPQAPTDWITRATASKVGAIIQALMFLMLVSSVGGLLGVMTWNALGGIAETIALSPKVFLAAIVGAALSTIGFGLFSLILGLLGPVLSMVFEEWTAFIAPIVGGTVGAAIGSELAINIILIAALGALTGGISAMLYLLITGKKRAGFKELSDQAIAGLGFGLINGVIVALLFKLLEITVGMNWLIAA